MFYQNLTGTTSKSFKIGPNGLTLAPKVWTAEDEKRIHDQFVERYNNKKPLPGADSSWDVEDKNLITNAEDAYKATIFHFEVGKQYIELEGLEALGEENGWTNARGGTGSRFDGNKYHLLFAEDAQRAFVESRNIERITWVQKTDHEESVGTLYIVYRDESGAEHEINIGDVLVQAPAPGTVCAGEITAYADNSGKALGGTGRTFIDWTWSGSDDPLSKMPDPTHTYDDGSLPSFNGFIEEHKDPDTWVVDVPENKEGFLKNAATLGDILYYVDWTMGPLRDRLLGNAITENEKS